MRSTVGFVVLTVFCLVALPATAGVIFVTDGDSARLQGIDTTTGNLLFTATTHTIGYPIAVRDTIWIGERDNLGTSREYNPDGTFAGGTAALPGPDRGNFVDGAVNGGTNYTLDAFFDSDTTVYSTNPDWTSPVALFDIAGGNDYVGIAYDPFLDSLWISDQNSIYQYTLGGGLVDQFAHGGGRGSLAFEFETNSLWYVPNRATAPLLQFGKNGDLLTSLNTPTRSGNIWGAEFGARAVPEPVTVGLMMLGLGSLFLRGRRRSRR